MMHFYTASTTTARLCEERPMQCSLHYSMEANIMIETSSIITSWQGWRERGGVGQYSIM